MKTTILPLALAAAALAAGCSSHLKPAPAANAIESRAAAATAAENDVRVIASANAWSGVPQTLGQQLTPLLVTIENHSSRALRIDYNNLRLVSDQGRRYSALPPFGIDQTVNVSVGSPYYTPTGFQYPGYMSPYFPSAPTYGGVFEPNALYWDRFGPVWNRVRLPTVDMLQKALSEGVLQPGGRVTGFVYFEGVGSDVQRVRFIAEFENPDTGRRVASVAIPFKVG